MSIFNKVFDFDFFGKKAKERVKELEIANSVAEKHYQDLHQEFQELDKDYDTLLRHDILKEAKKPYKSIIYSNGIITVIFNDGSVISVTKPVETIEMVKNATDESQIIALLKVEEVKVEIDNNKEEVANIQKFAEYKEEVLELLGEDFNCKNEKFFYKTISLPINSLILNSLIEHKKNNNKEEFTALVCFFLHLGLIPIEESRNDLYSVIKQYNVKLTPNGNFLGYRSIWKVAEDTALLEYVSEQYFKKKRHKKSPNNYTVYTDGDDLLHVIKSDKLQVDTDYFVLGTLNDLYNSLQKTNDNRYTDDYTKKQDIRIGSVYKLPEKFELGKRGSCGGALHVSLGKDVYDYSSFGDTQVVCIINPRHVYRMDTGCGGKIGVKQMFIAAKENEENIEEQLVHFDEVYHNETIEELELALQNKSFDTISVQEEVPVINLLDLKQITNSLKSKIVNF
jgi:hypothetical protein